MSILFSVRRYLVKCLLLLLFGFSANAFAAGLILPVWQDIFHADGTVKNLQSGQGGVDAIFMADRLSLGLGIDSSAFNEGALLEDSSVNNAPVSLSADLGNAYLYSRVSHNGGNEFYVGVERMALQGHLVIEFNQQSIFVTQGQPWLFTGARSDGDLAIALWVNPEQVLDVVLLRWQGGAYKALVRSDSGSGCVGNGQSFIACAGALKFISNYEESEDSLGNPLGRSAEQLVEIGLNAGSVGGNGREYRSVLIHSAEDIVMGQFSRQGFVAVD